MQIRSKIQPEFQICDCEVGGKCARMTDRRFWLTLPVLFFLPVMTEPCRTLFTSWSQASKKVSVRCRSSRGLQRGLGASPWVALVSSLRESLSLVLALNSLDFICWSHPLSGTPLFRHSGSTGHVCRACRPMCGAVGAQPGTGACEVYLYLKRNVFLNTFI